MASMASLCWYESSPVSFVNPNGIPPQSPKVTPNAFVAALGDRLMTIPNRNAGVAAS
jgi:hypothetical protein